MGVEVHGLCVSLYRGRDFIRWYMGGHAIRACKVWEAEVKEHSSTIGRVRPQCLLTPLDTTLAKMIPTRENRTISFE